MGYSPTSRYKRTWVRKFICVDCDREFQIAQKGIVPPLELKTKRPSGCSECSEARRRDEERRRRRDYIRKLKPRMGPSTRRFGKTAYGPGKRWPR